MSLLNSIRIPFDWSNVDIFTFGKSFLYGYNSSNHCLIIHSLNELNNLNDISNDSYHLSSSPTWPIRKLILNEDETIIALIADKLAYLVYLPNSNNSPSKGSRLCPINRVSSNINYSLIDFVWLSSKHFIIVYSIPSSSECHLYYIQSLKQDGIEHIQTFSVGLSSSSSINKFNTPNKKFSLNQLSDIIKLDITKRKEDNLIFILLFAMKSNGDLFILEINQNKLLIENKIYEEFQGPLKILPSTLNNYGIDRGQSTFICLSNIIYPIIIFTHDKCQLNQSIFLSPTLNDYYLFTIDSISLPINENGQTIISIISDPFSSNKYYISDSFSNVYLIEISWINQIQHGLKQLQSTNIQHLINGNNSNQKLSNYIQQMGLIQINNQQQYLAVISKSLTNQQKELILVRSQSFESIENSSLSEKSSSEFVDRIHTLLSRNQSIPYVTLSTSSTNISDSDIEKNLLQFIKILNEEYISKQDKVRKELENKERYLIDVQQTQTNENKQLIEKFQQIQQKFQILIEEYQKECLRRQSLSTHVNDLLSIIEQNTPVLSDSEIRMQQQLERYEIQINCLKEKLLILQKFILSNQRQEQYDNLSMENIQNIVQNHRNQIEQIKKQIQTLQINK